MERRSRHALEEAEIFASAVTKGQASGSFRAGNALEIAEVFLIATNALVPSSLTTQELGKRKDIKDKILRTANLFLIGLER